MKIWKASAAALVVHAAAGAAVISLPGDQPDLLEFADADATLSNINQIAIVRLGVRNPAEKQPDEEITEPDLPPPPPPPQEPVKQAPPPIATAKPVVSLMPDAETEKSPPPPPRTEEPDEPVADIHAEEKTSEEPDEAYATADSSTTSEQTSAEEGPAGDPDGEAPEEEKSQPPLTTSQKRDQQEYLVELMGWLARHRVYPPELKKAKVQGVAKVRFTIQRDGRISNASVAQTSGDARLDAAALNVLTRANPGPKFPRKLPRDSFTLTLPIEFSLITE